MSILDAQLDKGKRKTNSIYLRPKEQAILDRLTDALGCSKTKVVALLLRQEDKADEQRT